MTARGDTTPPQHGGAADGSPAGTQQEGAPPQDPTVAPAAAPRGAGSSLFGRDLLYVAVWSLQLVSAVVLSPVLAYLLPPAEFGQLASAIALNQILVVLAVFGLDQALILQRAQTGSDTPARSILAVGVLVAGLLTALALVTARFWSPEFGFTDGSAIVLVAVCWTLPAAGVQLVSALLLSQDRLKAFTLVNGLAAFGGQFVGVVLLLVSGSRSAGVYAMGSLVFLSLTLLVGLLLVRPRWRGVLEVDRARRAFSVGIPLMIGGLAVFVLNAGDRLVIQRLLGATEAGRYQIAYTVGFAAVLVLNTTTAAWAPRLSAVRDEVERWALIGHARDGLVKLMTPVMLGVVLAAPFALSIVAPPSYRPEDLLVVVLFVVMAGFPVLIDGAASRALVTLERTRSVAAGAIWAALVNIALNLALVPRWGLTGAAVATVVAFSVQTLAHRLALPRGIRWPGVPPTVVWPAVAVVGVSAATLLLPETTPWHVGRFAVAVLACLPWLLFQLRAVRGNELARPAETDQGAASAAEPG